MANPAGPGAPDPRSLVGVAQDIVLDLGKLVSGLHAAGADPQSTTMLTHMAEMMGELGKALSAGPVGQHPADQSALAAGPQAAQGPQQAMAPQGPPAAPMHGSELPAHAMATPPSAQGAPGAGPAHGPIHQATNHLKVAMQASKAAAAAHAAMAAQLAGQQEPAPSAGK